MNKADLKDLTFLIPLRLDSIERIENLQLVVDFLFQNTDTHIHILEAAKWNNGILKKILPDEVQIDFEEDFDPIFHRTHYINALTRKAVTPYFAIWDADVVVPVEQLMESIQLLRTKKADFVYPYIDLFFDVPEIIKEHYHEARKIDILIENVDKMEKMYLPNPVGGGFLVNRKAYIEVGLENENFYGWGIEDGERINRWKILGYNVKRIPGAIFHFTHSRNINSQFHDKWQGDIKSAELFRIGLMSKQELKDDIKNWKSENASKS